MHEYSCVFSEHNRIILQFVPRHQNNQGNQETDFLVNEGSGYELTRGIAHRSIKSTIKNWLRE